MGSSKRIPIKSAKDIALKYGKNQVIILSWDKPTNSTTVTTYGKSLKDCENASEAGNKIKKMLGWPEELCNEKPSRSNNLDLNNEELTTDHNTNVVSSFMDHCKDQGIDIPDSAFETYFNA